MAKKNSLAWLWIILVLVAVVVGFFWFKKAKLDSGGVTIKYPQTPTTPTPWEIVQKLTGRDILKEEGVHLDFVPAAGAGVPTYEALLSGLYDVGLFDWTGWINVIARGGKIKAVNAGAGVTKIEKSGILVLDNSDIHSIKDLKGKTIAVNILGLGAEYTIDIFLQKSGLLPSDVQLLQVPMENEEEALRTKQVDAAAGTSGGGTWFDLALGRGGLRIIPGTNRYNIYGHDTSILAVGFRDDFIQAHPDAVRHFVTAAETAKRIIWDAFQKNPEQVRKVAEDLTTEKGGNPLLAKYYLPVSPNATIIRDGDIQFWIDLFVQNGKLKPGQLKPSDIYTNEFNSFVNN